MGGSGTRSAVGAVDGLSGRWEAGNLLQRACGTIGLMDWTEAWSRSYTDQVSRAGFTGSLQEICRADDAQWTANENVRIDHFCFEVLVTHQFLNCANVLSSL
jgi:hypothetical protein